MMSLRNIFEHPPSTLTGLGLGATWILAQITSAAGCSVPLSDWKSWGPALALAIIGGLAGPRKRGGGP